MAVNGEYSKLSPIFVAYFCPKIQAIKQGPVTIQNTEEIKRNLTNVRIRSAGHICYIMCIYQLPTFHGILQLASDLGPIVVISLAVTR